MLEALNRIDRRWIFLALFLAIGIPLIKQPMFPDQPTVLTAKVFDYIEKLPAGSLVVLALDYEPSSGPELDPMTAALVRHCCVKKHRMIFMTLWPGGPQLIENTIKKIIEDEFRDARFVYGTNYLNLGYVSGDIVIPKKMALSIREAYSQDRTGKSLDEWPIMKGVTNLQNCQFLISISAGFPGAKEWIQFASSPYNIPFATGCTGVQAAQFFPYLPDQILGLLVAIKGGAEYESALAAKYPQFRSPKFMTATRMMGPQLFAHLLMIGLIGLGNVIYLAQRWNAKVPS